MNHHLTRGYALAVWLLLAGCTASTDTTQAPSLAVLMADQPALEGRPDYRQSPYVTAGDRVYMVGHQDGRFPDLGWHVEGEMGGVWDHPIKLMDGFVASITDASSGVVHCLREAQQFVNYPLANKHGYEADGLRIERFQFVPDGLEGLVVEYTIENPLPEERHLAFSFTGLVDLTPVWLAERADIVDGDDTASWDTDHHIVVAKDSLHDWYVVLGSRQGLQGALDSEPADDCLVSRKGRGMDVTFTYDVTVEAGGTSVVPFYIAGSYTSEGEALSTYWTLQDDAQGLLEAKKERYAALKATADLTIPDKKLQEVYTWVKYNTDWLIRDVPEIGRGLSAGLPDYPWWFGADNTYALQGVLATGRPDLAASTLRLLHALSERENGNGRIVHEVSTNGVVFNPGNLNETPQFAMMVWTAYEWTGDRDMLATYYPTVKKGLDWLLTEQDEDRNGYPDGAGMMEIHGLTSEMIDVVVYTQQALEAAARMAEALGEPDQAQTYAETARRLKDKINTDWWVEEAASYADFKATTRQTLALIEDALVRADTLDKPWAVAELEGVRQQIASSPSEEKRGHVVHHNWVVNTPMEAGVAEADKALRALETGGRYTSPFGVYVTGIDRNEGLEGGSLASPRWKSFSYVGAVMTLPTGVQAIAEARYGRPDRAYDYLKKLTNSFSYALPGSMYEVSPDYGMMAQAWTIYAVAVPIVTYFFGIHPRSYDEHVTIRPRMPDGWDDAELENLPIGDNVLTLEKETRDGTIFYTIHQRRGHWTIDLNLPYTDGVVVEVNGSAVQPEVVGHEMVVRLSGEHNVIRLVQP